MTDVNDINFQVSNTLIKRFIGFLSKKGTEFPQVVLDKATIQIRLVTSEEFSDVVDESNLSKIRRIMVEIAEKYSKKSKHDTCPVSKVRYELPRRCKKELQRDIGYYINDAKEAGIIDILGSETRQVCRVVPEDERERRLDEIEKEAHEFVCKAEEAARKAEETGGNVWGQE